MKKIIFNSCLKISNSLRLENWILGNISSAHTYMFFLGLGPKMIVVRNNEIISFGSAFKIIVKFNDKKEIISCLPAFMDTEKDDLVFYRQKAHDAYQKYKKIENESSVGMEIVC
ncbi:MAG: hypothetical protein NT068_01445 [Candidatus Nomurabacteria bacterium]|nr:hypothetical protein [Candidatus Nomurabacteria bacterium]